MKSSTKTVPNAATASPSRYVAELDAAWAEHLKPKAADAPTVVSTFAGGGGSSLGYSMAGYRELLAVEIDAHAVQTLRANFPNVPIYHGDIAKLSVSECLDRIGLQPGELTVLDGSPPCQGFSTAGKRDASDPRNQLFREYVRLLRGLKPQAFVMENVSGMVKGEMKLIFAEALRELKASGYDVSARILNAMYYGVPQSRQRMIFVGFRDDLGIKASHPKAATRPRTAREAVEGVVYVTQGRPLATLATKIWNSVKPGDNGTKYRAGNYFNSIRVHPDRPMPTVPKEAAGSGGHMHWSEPRRLTIEELKRGSSYPDAYRLVGSFDSQHARIGNSVPPFLMRAVALHVRSILAPTARNGG